MEGHVKTETHHGITSIEFFHPHSNSLPAWILHELAVAILHAGDNPDCIVIILRAGGDRAFCAGASFDELVEIKNAEEGFAFFKGFALVINAMRTCPKFIIGRIHGKCVGGGVGLAASVDYAIATEAAEIKLSELAMGIGPFVVGPVLERRIGLSAYGQLSIDAGMWRNADWAKRNGLYAEVHDSKENMDESVNRLAGTLAQSSPQAMAELKKILWKGTEHWDKFLEERAAISGKLVLSDFTKEAIEKFRKKKA